MGTVDDAGHIDAQVSGRFVVQGTVEALEVRAGSTLLFRGTLEALHPLAVAPTAADVQSVLGPWATGAVGVDGVFRGMRDGVQQGWALDGDAVPFGGPAGPDVRVAELHRRYGTGIGSLERVVADHAGHVGGLLPCTAGGIEQVRVGPWPDPVPLAAGRRAVWSTAQGVRVRSPKGQATTFIALPMDRALAASVAAELAEQGGRSAVAWRGGMGLISTSDDPLQPLPSTVEPKPGEAPILSRLDLAAPADPPRPILPILDPGAEAVAWLNQLRVQSGLAPLTWDDGLGLAALQHAAYAVHTDRRPSGHHQDPASPLFLGARPDDRGGAAEVLLTSHPPLSPRDAVDLWIGAPYHRVPLLHPRATHIGAASLGGVWVAEVVVEPGRQDAAWPQDGATSPDVQFVGREDPDPLPTARFPERRWPVGFPITLWTPERVRSSEILQDGVPVDHWVIRSALGTPDIARHLIPKQPLELDSTVRWTASTRGLDDHETEWAGTFLTPDAAPDALEPLPAPIADVVRRANDRRDSPLRTTVRAAGLARLMSARTRAMAEGLSPDVLRDVLAPVQGDGDGVVKICLRPGEAFDLDEALLDPELTEIGADARGTTVTWRSNPEPRAHLASPRTCLFLFGPA